MKIKISLDNGGGELDGKIIDAPDAQTSDDASDQIQEVITAWTLSVGDTITIREV